MMVIAYPNGIDGARSGRQIPSPLPSFFDPCAGFYPHRRDFHLAPKLLGTQASEFLIQSHHARSSKLPKLYQVRDSSGAKKRKGHYNQ